MNHRSILQYPLGITIDEVGSIDQMKRLFELIRVSVRKFDRLYTREMHDQNHTKVNVIIGLKLSCVDLLVELMYVYFVVYPERILSVPLFFFFLLLSRI